MSRSAADLASLLTLMGEAHDLDELEPFTPVVLQRVADLLGSEQATYYELDITTGEISVYVRNSYQPAFPIPQPIPRVDRARHEELWDRSQDGVGAWSDVYPRVVRRRLEVTREQSFYGYIDAAWMAFGDRRSRSCFLALHQSRDFTETQRDRFLGTRAHVASLIRHADARRRLADVMVAVDAAEEGVSNAILLLGPSLGVERASPAARRMVTRWFGRFGSELPEELADWSRTPFPRQPLRVERGGERLVVEAPSRGALVLREERVGSVSLTAREREVMSHVADGMSTDEIARAIWVTPGTVSKHLEHIYRKLGVTGRTAALAALRRTT